MFSYVSIGLAILGIILIIFSENKLKKSEGLERQYNVEDFKNTALKAMNEKLNKEIEALKSDDSYACLDKRHQELYKEYSKIREETKLETIYKSEYHKCLADLEQLKTHYKDLNATLLIVKDDLVIKNSMLERAQKEIQMLDERNKILHGLKGE